MKVSFNESVNSQEEKENTFEILRRPTITSQSIKLRTFSKDVVPPLVSLKAKKSVLE